MSSSRLSRLLRSLSSKRKTCCSSAALRHVPSSPQLIVMTLPPRGESMRDQDVYMAQMLKAATDLVHKHRNKFMVHNLTGDELDAVPFGGSVVRIGAVSNFRGANHPPSLKAVLTACRAVQSWLGSDEGNVAVLYCTPQAAATTVLCVQAFCGLTPEPWRDAAARGDPIRTRTDRAYAALCSALRARSLRGHQHFLHHFVRLWAGSAKALTPSAAKGALTWAALGAGDRPWLLSTVEMRGVPTYPQATHTPAAPGCRPFILVIQGETVLYSSLTGRGGPKQTPSTQGSVVFPVGRPAQGDIIFRLYHLPMGKPGAVMCTFAFHTSFACIDARSPPLGGGGGGAGGGAAAAAAAAPSARCVTVDRSDIDDLCSEASFPADFRLSFTFEAPPPAPTAEPERELPSGPSLPGEGAPAPAPPVVAVAAAAGPAEPAAAEAAEVVEVAEVDTSNDEAMARALQAEFQHEAAEYEARNLRAAAAADTARDGAAAARDHSSSSSSGGSDDGGDGSFAPPDGGEAAPLAEAELDARVEDSRAAAGARSPPAAAAAAADADADAELLTADELFARDLQRQFDEEVQRERDAQHARRREREQAEAGERESAGARAEGGQHGGIPSRPIPPHLEGGPSSRHRRRRPRSHADPPRTTQAAREQALEDLLGPMFHQLEHLHPHHLRLHHHHHHHHHPHGMRFPSRPTDSLIAALPTSTVTLESNLLDRECQVCYAPYEIGDVIKTLPCLHIYHAGCIDPWLHQKPTCPVCMTRIDVDVDLAGMSDA